MVPIWSALPDNRLADLTAVARAIRGRALPPTRLVDLLEKHSGPVYVQLRASGKLVRDAWAAERNQWMSLCLLLQSLREVEGEELLVCFCRATDTDVRSAAANVNRGLFAFEFGSTPTVRISPLEVIAQNRPLEKYLSPYGLRLSAFNISSSRIFLTDQFRVDLKANTTVRLFRGSQLVALPSVCRPYIEQLDGLLSNYLIRSVHPNGRMVYLYYPSQGAEDQTRNNAIRQWMATRALIQIWKRGRDDLLPLIKKNIEFNLRSMYREEGGKGLILDGEKVKLGAVAMAALAMAESPFDCQVIYRQLLSTVESLWTENGQFRTFYRPAGRMDCQNFYPGEALLLWSRIPDDSIQSRFWKSFSFYQQWHHANRNPAFIPWHTQAYFNVWQQVRDERLAKAIFEMNDWLLDVQQWQTAPYPDCQGRFYDPQRPFGPPHASSTGVYLEGLADAFSLARELADERRLNSYRLAIIRGLRSIAQLTFKDDVDMFYVAKRGRLRGGVRTTEYNNIVRIDNVQHPLMAIHKVLDTFADDDFQTLP